MEALPVEVIGNILSHLEAARDVTVASLTCRKWRDAACRYLHRLSFHHEDWAEYKQMSSEELEVLITQTVLQTTCLRHLSICFENQHFLSAAPVVAWLMHTRDTLRFLTYVVQTSQNIEVLDRCARHKLEGLVLGHICVAGTVPGGFPTYPALTTLTLSQVRISTVDLNLLMGACSRLNSLSLVCLEVSHVDIHEDLEATIQLTSASVRTFHIEELRSLDNIILYLDCLEVLSLKEAVFEKLEIVSKGNLRVLSIDNVTVIQLDIGQCNHLEAVDVVDATIMWPRLYEIMAGAGRLSRLKLWGLPVGEEQEENMDLGALAACCPGLYELSLGYDYSGFPELKTVGGAPVVFHRVCLLEVSSARIDTHFAAWLQELVKRCPSLKRLVVRGVLSSQLSDAKGQEDYQMVADFTTAMVRLMRKLSHVAVEFHYS